MTIPTPSTTQLAAMIAADEALRTGYFDAETAQVGDTIPYRDEDDDTDDRAWHDAEGRLAQRGMYLEDVGGGYRVTDRAPWL